MQLLAIFVIAVVFTALILPMYRSYTLNEHSKLAAAVLMDVSQHRQTWQVSHPDKRLPSLESLGYGGSALYVNSDGDVRPSANINSIYRVSLSVPAEPSPQSCGLVAEEPIGFVLVAEPIQTQRIDTACGRLCLSSTGKRATTGTMEAQCWGRH